MGKLIQQKSVQLIISLFSKEIKFIEKVEKKLIKLFGEEEDLTKILPFEYTNYYLEEFGNNLKRKLICFKKLVNKEEICEIKLKTNKIEDYFKIKNKRIVNIDPGYITEAKLVLLTTKDYTHRIYIGKKIFADPTLFFQNKSFRSWPWTYPDYASLEMINYFNEVREMYVKKIS